MMINWNLPSPSCQVFMPIINRLLALRSGFIIFLLYILVYVPFLLEAKFGPGRPKKLPFGCWMRSQEEEKPSHQPFQIYRSCAFSFPPARGRSGIILEKSGKIAFIKPSPLDGRDTLWGNWEQVQPKTLLIQFPGKDPQSLKWHRFSKTQMGFMIEMRPYGK